MSKEEKKAIEVELLKAYLKTFKKMQLGEQFGISKDFIQSLEYCLNLIEKQQKQIEKLKFDNHMVSKWNEYLDKDCISKNRIREKIKDYDKWIEETYESAYLESLQAQKYALEELLEENNAE